MDNLCLLLFGVAAVALVLRLGDALFLVFEVLVVLVLFFDDAVGFFFRLLLPVLVADLLLLAVFVGRRRRCVIRRPAPSCEADACENLA